MAGKKSRKTSKKASKKEQSLSERISSISTYSGDSYKSLLYGAVTVVVLFILGFSITRLILHRPQPAIDDRAVSTSTLEEALKNPTASGKTYTVQEGETLWSISEEKLGSGFEWYRIAELNKISDPAKIEKGTILALPSTEKQENPIDENKTTPTEETNKISSSTYKIMHGDDLWDIAVRAYGDGYRWIDIAKANNISNPNLIHGDNTLKIPR